MALRGRSLLLFRCDSFLLMIGLYLKKYNLSTPFVKIIQFFFGAGIFLAQNAVQTALRLHRPWIYNGIRIMGFMVMDRIRASVF